MLFRCPQCGAFNRVPKERPAGEPSCGRCHQTFPLTGEPQEVDSEALWRAVQSAPVPVMVDLWAPWCGPCRTAGPIFTELGKERAGELVVLKVNTDANPELSAQLGIRGIPTFLLFKQGREVARRSGVMPKPALASWVDEYAR
jgi:thioredoxin 2